MKCLIIVALSLLFLKGNAQNLFANPGFEDINTCTEYHMQCAPEGWFNVNPVTNPLVQAVAVPEPLLGTNLLLVPVANVLTPAVRPYVYTMFLCPLEKEKRYKLSFYINTPGRKFYHIDFLFSEKEPMAKGFSFDSLQPSLIVTEDAVVAEVKGRWQAVELEYTAKGGEKFCMIGNMGADMPYSIKDKLNKTGRIYYFLDEIKMKAMDAINCPEYEENIKKLYAQNFRHTEYQLVDPDAEKPVMPKFRSDTLIIPAAFFETNSAIPKKGFAPLADSIIALIPLHGVAKIDIYGHTDDRGKPDSNLVLSERRANAVLNYFVGKLPALKDNIFATGRGQGFPKADNTTEKGRAINRRVEIIFTYLIK